MDGLTGFPDVIEAVYPEAEIRKFFDPPIHNTTRFVSCKDIKPLRADLERLYTAVGEAAALFGDATPPPHETPVWQKLHRRLNILALNATGTSSSLQ